MKKMVTIILLIFVTVSVAEHCENIQVCTNAFCVRGCKDQSVDGDPIYSFTRIPYAKPPVGNLRFMPPQRIRKYPPVIDRAALMPFCTQVDLFKDGKVMGVEDCLYLSLFIRMLPPDNGTCEKLLPVMVWIHGGGFISGGGSPDIYSPRFLLNGNNQNVILVSINYRLGPLGFLSTGDEEISGNMGLKDQTMALQWVQQYIRFFCGDTDRVTIFGQSAGAASVHYHMLSPMSKGLFHRAILQSGSARCHWAYITPEEARLRAQQTAELMDCPSDSSSNIRKCLQRSNANDLAALFYKTHDWDYFPLVWNSPTKEPEGRNRFMTKSPMESMEDGDMADVPMMAGVCQSEGEFIVSGLWKRETYYELNDDYLRLFPLLLGYDYCGGTKCHMDKISRKIRRFYYDDRDIDDDTLPESVKVISDNFMISCSYRNVRDHLKREHKNKSYFYMFTFRGPINAAQLPTNFTGGPEYQLHGDGPTHGDDLFPLFGIPLSNEFMEKGSPLRNMSDMMTAWWTNFAAFGNPTPRGGEQSDVIWKSVEKDSFNYLNMTLQPMLQTDFLPNRMTFWGGIDRRIPDCF